ncbi:uncharacterized protein LOC127086850 [Lathyrus oleraceus]|uniref:uncharacterized protein LOC127086850 n=1 Tax=Pisum sativum TaxID=3888 RepID=UPI0021D38FE8|nr:uncharacterized protein LOC127086850 [Pisum sativum]
MAQLADKVRKVERLKIKKSRVNKGNKERVAFVNMEANGFTSNIEYNHVKEIEVDVAELKPGPLYVCKLLTPANGKNPSEPEKNEDGQVIVPPGAKVPPLEERKKRGFCKYHKFLWHKTSQCFLFWDLVHNALNEGRLKPAKSKDPMKINSESLQVGDAIYIEHVTINMVKITVDFDMVEFESENQIEVVYPKDGEGLLEFLHGCKAKDSYMM